MKYKILLVHNFYGSSAPSGENQVFQAEYEMLKKNGHEVILFTRSSDAIRKSGVFGLLVGGLSTIWNIGTYFKFKKLIHNFAPDLIHVHNTFPLISNSVFYATQGRIPIITTLHNYRYFCAAGVPMRKNNPCTKCIDAKSSLNAIIYKCYRNSLLATLPLAISIQLHEFLGTWRKKVSIFIAFTQFQKKMLIKAGIPEEKIRVKPNFFSLSLETLPWQDRGNYIVYIGRLSEEKGVKNLIHAWKIWGASAPQLLIIGAGDLEDSLSRFAKDLNVKMLGKLPSKDTLQILSRSKMLILPSLCYEGFPMVIQEAFALGTPVAVSSIGPLPEIILNGECGILFDAKDSNSIATNVRDAWLDEKKLIKFSKNSIFEFNEKYKEEINYEILKSIYKDAYEAAKYA